MFSCCKLVWVPELSMYGIYNIAFSHTFVLNKTTAGADWGEGALGAEAPPSYLGFT